MLYIRASRVRKGRPARFLIEGLARMLMVVATMNRHKFEEISQILRVPGIDLKPLWDVEGAVAAEEDAETFEGNAAIKALAAARASGLHAIADDSGLSVDALGGDPGVRSARFAGPDQDAEANMDKLLGAMSAFESEESRSASFVCAVVLASPSGIVFSARGETRGRILLRRDGTGGFGYDPIFHSFELGMSFGRAGPGRKNPISHRGRAFARLREFLTRRGQVFA